MIWSEVQITTSNEAEEAVAEAFYDAGAGGVVIESAQDVTDLWDDPTVNLIDEAILERPAGVSVIRGYFPVDEKSEARISEILVKTAKLPEYGIDPGSCELSISDVEDEDWAENWKQYFKPTHVAEHITVVPSWEDYTPSDKEKIIDMDPGMAFGTGTHETTRLCAQALEDFVKPGMRVVDVGCGTGILSIIAAKCGAEHVTGVDLDPLAVKASKENAVRNEVMDKLTLIEGDLVQQIEEREFADIVVANILAQAVMALTPDANALLKPGGLFLSSGIIGQYVEDVRTTLKNAGFDVLETRQLGEWYLVAARKHAPVLR